MQQLKKILIMWKQIWSRLKVFKTKAAETDSECGNTEDVWENPYVDSVRALLPGILAQRGLTYQQFRPVLMDTDCPEQSFLEADDVERILAQILDGLNGLEILTDRPEYFAAFVKNMYEEFGLCVQVYDRSYRGPFVGNVILDLERKGRMDTVLLGSDLLYLPFYKRCWKQVKQRSEAGDYLDIQVPIGYNIVTVKMQISELR